MFFLNFYDFFSKNTDKINNYTQHINKKMLYLSMLKASYPQIDGLLIRIIIFFLLFFYLKIN